MDLNTSKSEAKLAVDFFVRVAGIVLEAIRASGPHGLPDGHLYMHLQSSLGESWTLRTHQLLIETLVAAGKITNHNFLLKVV